MSVPDRYLSFVKQLDLTIRARYPLLYIVSVEEEPVEEILELVTKESLPQRQLLFWDIARGWSDNNADKGSIMGALSRISSADRQESILYVLRDLHFVLKHPQSDRNAPVIREIKNLTKELKRSRQTLILLSHSLEVPEEIKEKITVIDFPLPDAKEIDYLITQLVVPEKLKVQGLAREQLVKACQGLSRARIQRVLAKALADKQEVNQSDIDGVLEEKKQTIRQTGILEFFNIM